MIKLDINDILRQNGISKTELARITGIPYKTIQNWTADETKPCYRKCPAWTVRLIEYFVRTKGYEK